MKVAQALASEASFNILRLLSKEKLDVSTIADRLDLSEAHVSDEIGNLIELNLVKANYAPGKRGIRKICELAADRVVIVIKQ